MELITIKNKVAKISREKNIDVQTAWDLFFFDEFLYRLSRSDYSKSFVLKGGFYLQSVLGVETRSTMDIDLKYVGNQLSAEELKQVFSSICKDSNDSSIVLEIKDIEDIRAETKYGGKTVKIDAQFFNIKKRFGIDIGFGDVITPCPIVYDYKLSFIDEECKLLAYTDETSIAEKFETLVSKGANNSRSKDLLDLYLYSNKGYDEAVLNAAMINTFYLRGTDYDKDRIKSTLDDVFSFDRIRELYVNYSKKHRFAEKVSYEECKDCVYQIFNNLVFNERISIKDYEIELHLIRHGQDEKDKLGGWSENHLAKEGIQEIESTLYDLDKDYDLFISSDLNRAKESSNIINQALGMEIVFDQKFREINNGILKNLTKDEFMNKYPNMFFSSLEMNQKYPEGESPNDFYQRVSSAFIQLLENNKNKKILLVTHQGVINIILCMINGFPYSNKLKIGPSTGTLIKIR